jgi:hypothetical protein
VDAPKIEEILPPGSRAPRDRTVAAVFGLPGLATAFLAGMLSGIAFGAIPAPAGSAIDSMGPSPSSAESAPASTSSSASPAASAVVGPTGSPGPTTSPRPSPSAGPRPFVALADVPVADWPPAIVALLETTPNAVRAVSVTGPSAGESGDWFVTFTADAGVTGLWDWVVGLPATLRALGFSHAEITSPESDITVRYVDAPGLVLTAADTFGVDGFGPNRRGVVVTGFISGASLGSGGRFTDDPRGRLARMGCTPGGAPSAVVQLAALVEDAGAVDVETAFCPSDATTPDVGEWRTFATLPAGYDPADLMARLDRRIEAWGRTMSVGWWRGSGFWDLIAMSADTSNFYAAPAAGGFGSYYTIFRDAFRPDRWALEFRTWTADLTSTGAYRPDPTP